MGSVPLRRRLFLVLLPIGLLGLGLAVFAWTHPLGPALLEVAAPSRGHDQPNVPLEVFLRFPHSERTRPETLRVLLNGADVTDAFDIAENGAYGDVVRLVDGVNVLRVGVFGRSWWSESELVEHTVERRFTVRRAIDSDWG